MIEIKNLCAGYSGCEVLHDFSTTFKKGKVTAIIGPNGCGKSTLLKSLIRLNPPMSGEILVDGQNFETLNSSELAQKVAYIAQSRKTPDISVRRMVLHGRFAYLKYPRRYRSQDYAIADRVMEKVGIEALADKNVSELSGGTQQKVYIAMALAQDTPAILMDEPTVFLDISYQLKTLKMAKSLAREGKTVVFSDNVSTESFVRLCQAFNEHGIENISEYDLATVSNISVMIDHRIEVRLGTLAGAADKLAFCKAVIDETIASDKKHPMIIDVTADGKAYARRKDDNSVSFSEATTAAQAEVTETVTETVTEAAVG